MAFKFYIDSQLTDQPDNDTELVTSIEKDADLSAVVVVQNVTLRYSQNNNLDTGTISGYTYLTNAFNLGTCNEVEVEIYDEVSATETYLVYKGVMKIPSMSIREGEINISTKIDDNSFYSYIKNNRNVPFNLYSDKTKNKLPITPPDVYEVDMFVSATGVYHSTAGNYFRGYRIYDILKFLVPAISDNKVTFESTYLQTAPGKPATPTDYIQLFLFDGSALANPNTNPSVVTSFSKIITELNKLKDISFYIDQTDPNAPVLRLELADWLYSSAQIYSFDEPLEIITSIKTSKIYGTIKVGSEYNPSGLPPTYTWNAGTSYFGWKEETYTPYGQCNTDEELDLKNDYYIASNAVNDQVNGATTSNLDEMFIVECDNVDTGTLRAVAVDYQPYGSGTYIFYNIGLNNVNKVTLHGGNFQSALTNTAAAGTNIFKASGGSDQYLMNQNSGSGLQSSITGTPAVLTPVAFADEFGGGNYDPGNNYSNTVGTYYYTCPIDGDYSFAATIKAEMLNFKFCITPQNVAIGQLNIQTQYSAYVNVGIAAYTNNTFTTLLDFSSQTFFGAVDGTYTWSVALVSNLPAGAVVRVRTSSQFVVTFPTIFGNNPLAVAVISGGVCGYSSGDPLALVIALSDSTFECNGTPDGALILAQPDPQAYKIRLHEFEYDINAADFRTIQAIPIGVCEFTKDGVTRRGWIDSLQYNNWTGRATIKLISQNATV